MHAIKSTSFRIIQSRASCPQAVAPCRPKVLCRASQREAGPQDAASSSGSSSSPQDFWAMKPAWCQPWSIVLTGVSISSGSWALLHKWWITAPVSAGILVWWWLFLVLVPQSYASYASQQIDVDADA